MLDAKKASTQEIITKQKLVEDLRRIGVDEGDCLAVALSLKSVGKIQGGADTFIDALIDTVGPQGTIMMNTHTRNFPISQISSDFVFDPETAVPWTGIVPQRLLKRRNVIRSRHPVTSVAAIGKQAKFLTEGHDEKAPPYSPFSRLAQINGKYLSIGIGNNLVAIRHEGQYKAGIPRFLLYGVKYKDKEGRTKLFVWEHPSCEKNLPSLIPKLENLGIIKRGKIGQANALLMQADDLIKNESAILRSNPALNQCSDVLCTQCRELESKTNLWKAVENPRFFQRSLFMRKTLKLRNQLLILFKHKRIRIKKRITDPDLLRYMEKAFTVYAKILNKILE